MKREKEYFPLFSFFISVAVTIKKRQPCGWLFVNINRLKKRSIPFQQSKRQLNSFLSIVEVEVP